MAIEILKTIFGLPVSYGVIAAVIVALLSLITFIVFKKIAFAEISILIAGIVSVLLMPNNHLAIQIIYAVLFWLLAGYSIYDFIITYQVYTAYDRELNNYLKNNEFDFFVQTNQKDLIIGYSNKLPKITKMSGKDIKGVYCWKLLLDYLKITKIDGKDINLATVSDFLAQFKSANSKHVVYSFKFEMPKVDDLVNDEEEPEYMNYIGIIQPVYYKKKLIGRNIYFYQDRMQVLDDLRQALKQATADLETSYNFTYMMMSLTDYVGLYFDYNTRTYVATEAFMKFSRTHQREYTFNQFLDMMHPNDVDAYIEQAATINSIYVTKLKYRLLINDDYYYVMEDSININKDADLVSVIRVLNKIDESARKDVPLSTNEAETMLDNLSTSNICDVMDKTENILNTVVGKDEKD
ncbi:MAG: hypothetical protein SOZ32_06510 [Bacilli bacterium]|nr:hypothetical protein [Mollicutes bacterium]MDY3899833.1 hypothetical protein [Bacilli bacterium]